MRVRWVIAPAIALLVATAIPARAGDKGRLERRFGERGIAHLAFGGAGYGREVERDRWARLLIAGERILDEGTSDVVVARLDRRGRLDPTFHRDGRVRLSRGESISVLDMDVDHEGGSAILGLRRSDDEPGPVVFRLDDRGRLVRSFGSRGVARIAFDLPGPTDASFVSVAVDRDGRVVLAATMRTATGLAEVEETLDENDPTGTVGGRTIPAAAERHESMVLLRLTDTGQLDDSYGIGGFVVVDPGDGAHAAAVVTTATRTIVAGTAGEDPDLLVAAFDHSGDPDLSFGTLGVARADWGGALATALAVDGAGRAVVGGSAIVCAFILCSHRPAIARLTDDGALDRSFGEDGIATLSADLALHDLDVSSSGRVGVVGVEPGFLFGPFAERVGVLHPSGKPVANFGQDGIRALPPQVWSGRGIVMHGGDPIVVGRADRTGRAPCGWLDCLFESLQGLLGDYEPRDPDLAAARFIAG